MTYQFTEDWFHWAPGIWEQLAPMLPDRKMFLEIGSYEGRSAVWIVENLMEDGGVIHCVDTWEGGEEHGDMSGVESRFISNSVAAGMAYPQRLIEKHKEKSSDYLAAAIPYMKERHDFIYIDGSHVAKDVLTDVVMAWPLLKPNGIMVMDDYAWGDPRDILHRPKIAVDAFVNIFSEDVEFVYCGYQMIIRKKKHV